MKFVVKPRDDTGQKPFENATREVVTCYDERTWATVDDAMASKQGRKWMQECKAITPGKYPDGTPYLRGEIEREEWVVDVPDLDALAKMMLASKEYVVSISRIKEYPLAFEDTWFWNA